MTALYRKISKFRRDESGASAIEYGLIIALVALGLVAALNVLSTDLGAFFSNLGQEIRDQVPGAGGGDGG